MDKITQTIISALDFTKSRFEYLEVPFSDEQGIPIGQGSAKAVILRYPSRTFNTNDAFVPAYVYFGDSQAQQFELQRGEESQLLMVTDLQEIFVRCPLIFDGVGVVPVKLGVIIYE